MNAQKQTRRPLAGLIRAAEVPALVAVPAAMVALSLAGVRATAGLTLVVVALALALVLAGFEASRPALRQLMPTAVLAAAGSGMDKAVKTTCFLADMDDFAAFNAVYAEYFPGKPARSCVAVKTLPKGALCEVEVIAEA